MLNRPGGFRDPGEPEEYCRGFQVFDKDMTGYIGVGQLRYSMFAESSSLTCCGRAFLFDGRLISGNSPDEPRGEDERRRGR